MTSGDPQFVGYLKIYPNSATWRESGYFVVAVGMKNERIPQTTMPFVCLIQEDIWEQFEMLPRTLAWRVSRAVEQQLQTQSRTHMTLAYNRHELELKSYKATATLGSRHSCGALVYKISVDLEQNVPAKRKRADGDNQSGEKYHRKAPK